MNFYNSFSFRMNFRGHFLLFWFYVSLWNWHFFIYIKFLNRGWFLGMFFQIHWLIIPCWEWRWFYVIGILEHLRRWVLMIRGFDCILDGSVYHYHLFIFEFWLLTYDKKLINLQISINSIVFIDQTNKINIFRFLLIECLYFFHSYSVYYKIFTD